MAEDDRPSPPSSAILQSPETPESPVIAVTKAPTEAGNDDDGGTSVAEPAPAPTTPNTAAADLANKAIEFLSTAPPEQLIAISIGGAVVLYAILGKLGLLVVGVVAGAVGHASLNVPHARKEGSAFSADLHNWIEAHKQARGHEDAALTKTSVKADFSSLPPETAKAMEELTDAVVRNYVRYWYTPLLPDDENFPNSCRNILANTFLAMYNRIASKRGADTFLLFLMSASNTFIVFLRELAAAQQTSIRAYMEESPSSALAQLLDRDAQKRKLRMAADDVLRSFFGKEVLEFEPVRTFLTEILAGIVLEMTVDKCSQPDWINSWLIYLLDVDTQPEVLQKIDIGEATAAATQEAAPIEKPKRLSRAEEEMSKALEEAKEMNRMIVEEEHERRRLSSTDVSVMGKSSDERSSTSMDNGSDRGLPDTEPAPTPSTPSSGEDPAFTNFDQIAQAPQQTLHRAHISLSDLTPPPQNSPFLMTPDAKTIRSKPTSAEYMLQIEPASPLMPGWVVVRKYTDFENLHEVLKRLSAISGADTFRRHHSELPTWRGETMASLRLHLEGYLNDALHEPRLADSEGMKRFLEKDPGTATPGKTGFGIGKGWPNPAAFAKMGQGALDVLSKAPQGMAEGGKGLFGGMKKAFTVGQRGDDGASTPPQRPRRQSTDPFGELPIDFPSQTTPRRPASMMERPTRSSFTAPTSRASSIFPPETRPRRSESLRGRSESVSSNYLLELPASEDGDAMSVISLPPPPCDMPDDYDDNNFKSSASISPILEFEPETEPIPEPEPQPEPEVPKPPPLPKKAAEPLTTQETQFIVDIVFALLTELYTLSSAWTLRRSLLNVAKSILLRPGNASLENIRVIIQETVIDANTSDEAVSRLIRKVRENVFPTPEEQENWVNEGPKGEELRGKARKLLLQKGVPEALRGVMGAAASEEALGSVFDALQMAPVARGVVGGVVLEGVRGVCQ